MKVFVTQIPHRRDQATGALVPSVNMRPAEEHGDMVVMMPPVTTFYETAPMIRQMREHLKDYDYDAGDSLVAVGDPSVIAAACALLGSMFGRFIILKWDRRMARYTRNHINVAA